MTTCSLHGAESIVCHDDDVKCPACELDKELDALQEEVDSLNNECDSLQKEVDRLIEEKETKK